LEDFSNMFAFSFSAYHTLSPPHLQGISTNSNKMHSHFYTEISFIFRSFVIYLLFKSRSIHI